MAIGCPLYTLWVGHDWKHYWPLKYPAWDKPLGDWEDLEDRVDVDDLLNLKRRHERPQERANRRMKKKLMKVARAQGFRKRDRMPGAWPI